MGPACWRLWGKPSFPYILFPVQVLLTSGDFESEDLLRLDLRAE